MDDIGHHPALTHLVEQRQCAPVVVPTRRETHRELLGRRKARRRLDVVAWLQRLARRRPWCVGSSDHSLLMVIDGRLPHAATAIERAKHVHRLEFGQPTSGARLERLPLLDQTQFARRRLAEAELGGDAAQHGGGGVIAADAVERAMMAFQVSKEDLEQRRASFGLPLWLAADDAPRAQRRKLMTPRAAM